MNRFFLIACFCFLSLISFAQHNHFVYVQSDNKQPFYVKLKEKLYSSSASGYVILPKLTAGEQSLSFGFPNNQFPNQNITINISGKDLGYLLKNFPGKGWGLFNIQSMDVVMASGASKAASTAQTETRTDAFSNTLADVVNTPSIKEVEKEKNKQEIKMETSVPAAIVAKAEEPKIEVVTSPQKNTETPSSTGAMSVIKKNSSSQSATAIAMQYFVTDDFGIDTVDIEIAIVPVKTEPVIISEPTPAKAESQTKPVETSKSDDPKFIDIDLPNPNADNKQKEPAVSKDDAPKPISATPEKSGTLTMINSDCKSMANEDDFLKTRKKMTSQKSDDAMVESAKKFFKQKCYSTEQVKNLSVLFLKDESRYKFYDAVYPFVYDSKSFKQLESTLTDEYYISRFRSMIRN